MDAYHCTLDLNVSAPVLFKALTTPEGFQRWWTEFCEVRPEPGETSVFRFGQTHMALQLESLEPDRSVVWLCTEHHHHLPGILTRTDEWVGTRLRFALHPLDEEKTRLEFHHEGLTPDLECYEICRSGWDHFLTTSLKNYVERGKGEPYNDRYPYSE